MLEMDQATEFEVDIRRNKLLGLWLAEKLGLPDSQHGSYAYDVIFADIEEPGGAEAVVKNAIEIHKVDISDSELRLKLDEFYEDARDQIILSQYPWPVV